MDVAYINPFILATRSVFDVMIHVSLTLGRPYLQSRDELLDKLYPVSAAIGLSGPVTGLVVLSLSETVALAMASGLANTRFEQLDTDSYDALAEITNMIAGNAKKDLPGGLVKLTVPTLLPTPDVIYPRGRPIIVIPFDTGIGRFLIEVALRQNADAAPKPAAQAASPLPPVPPPESSRPSSTLC